MLTHSNDLRENGRPEQPNACQAEERDNATESDQGRNSARCKTKSPEVMQSSNREQEIPGQTFPNSLHPNGPLMQKIIPLADLNRNSTAKSDKNGSVLASRLENDAANVVLLTMEVEQPSSAGFEQMEETIVAENKSQHADVPRKTEFLPSVFLKDEGLELLSTERASSHPHQMERV